MDYDLTCLLQSRRHKNADAMMTNSIRWSLSLSSCSSSPSFALLHLFPFVQRPNPSKLFISSPKEKKIMLMQKRPLASSSSGQPSQLKRPRTAPISQVRHRSERNLMPRIWWMEKVVRRAVREEWVSAKSDLVECLQSSMENAVKEMMQQISSTKNAVPELTETVELANSHSPHLGCANAKSTGVNDVRNSWLQIQAKLSDTLFTGKKLEGEGGASISIALINAHTGDVVRSGPESSIKLDVVVLDGDFNKDDEDNWAQEEFENYVVRERERKGPLLTGDLQLTLKGGVGKLGELIFMDNSSWNRSKKFRIGLKVASGYCGNTRIREAKTDAFRVKEHRGESNKKHYPPASDDEVWRLEKIAKDGKSHQKLKDAGIHKVEDFLQQLSTDLKKLRGVLGKLTTKNWECLVDHAKTCTNWKPCENYPNHAALFSTDRQPTGLIEDMVYLATDQLSFQEKEPGDAIVKKAAFNNWNDVREFNGENYSGSMQKNSSQVIEGQIKNLVPVQCNLAPRTCAAPIGPEALPANAGSSVEGHNGGTALLFPGQSQNTICGDATEFSDDGSVPLAAHQPISADSSNGLFSPGYDGITSFGLQIQSNDIISQSAMRSHDPSSQMDSTVNELVFPSEQPYAPISSFQRSGTLPGPGADRVMEDSQSNVAYDMMKYLLEIDDTPFLTSPWDDGDVRHQQRL